MRELPEPDGEHDRVFERGTVVYKKESVLAIQKQAYEDGLRDAADRADSVGHHWSGAPAHALFGLAESLRAMLTASQKEQK